jgi:Na+-transporting methylmalonyl-CoA/oxaloacetate decarboxylase gamma subunit
MGRVFLVLFLLLLIAAGLGFFALGAFPPQPVTSPVHKIMPNDKFGHTSG